MAIVPSGGAGLGPAGLGPLSLLGLACLRSTRPPFPRPSGCFLGHLWLLLWVGGWLLRLAGRYLGFLAYVSCQLNSYFGGWRLALLTGQGLSLFDLVQYGIELRVSQPDALGVLQDYLEALGRLDHVARHCHHGGRGGCISLCRILAFWSSSVDWTLGEGAGLGRGRMIVLFLPRLLYEFYGPL